MKRFNLKMLVAAVAVCGTSLSSAAIGPDIFNHLGANVQVGTNGITLEAATKVTRFVDIRAGVDFMPGFHINTDADYVYDGVQLGGVSGPQVRGTVDLEGNMKRTQGHVIANVYPVPGCSFYVAVGGYFGGSKLLKISGHVDEVSANYAKDYSVLIGDFQLPVDPNGNVSGGLEVKKFRPYVGLGYGRAVPNKLLNFGFELGVQFEGKPSLYTDYGVLDTSVIEDDNTYQKITKYLKVYPTLSFKLQFRAF